MFRKSVVVNMHFLLIVYDLPNFRTLIFYFIFDQLNPQKKRDKDKIRTRAETHPAKAIGTVYIRLVV